MYVQFNEMSTPNTPKLNMTDKKQVSFGSYSQKWKKTVNAKNTTNNINIKNARATFSGIISSKPIFKTQNRRSVSMHASKCVDDNELMELGLQPSSMILQPRAKLVRSTDKDLRKTQLSVKPKRYRSKSTKKVVNIPSGTSKLQNPRFHVFARSTLNGSTLAGSIDNIYGSLMKINKDLQKAVALVLTPIDRCRYISLQECNDVLGSENLNGLSKIWKLIDADSSGVMSMDEAIIFNILLHKEATIDRVTQDAKLLFDLADFDGNGTIEEMEWYKAWKDIVVNSGSSNFVSNFVASFAKQGITQNVLKQSFQFSPKILCSIYKWKAKSVSK